MPIPPWSCGSWITRCRTRPIPRAPGSRSDQEFGVAAWAYANKQVAGRFTDTLPQSAATWFPLQTATSVMGVLGLRLSRDNESLDFQRRQAVEAFALQLALVLEKEHFIQAVSQAELMDKSERLRSNLLDSVSHELKTPLAVIRASIEGMGAAAANPYVVEIDTATKRLQRLVDGLLQMTRLESKVVEPQLEWCDVGELVEGAVKAAGDALKNHPVKIEIAADIPLVKTDQALLVQALANILHNAAVYSPESSGDRYHRPPRRSKSSASPCATTARDCRRRGVARVREILPGRRARRPEAPGLACRSPADSSRRSAAIFQAGTIRRAARFSKSC